MVEDTLTTIAVNGHVLPVGQLYRTTEAAELLNVHVETVRRAIRSGALRCYRIGPRTTRVSSEQLAEYLAGTTA